jgi:hypothetical protein
VYLVYLLEFRVLHSLSPTPQPDAARQQLIRYVEFLFIMFNFIFCPLVPYLRNSLPLLVILVPEELCILPSSFRMNPLRVCEGLLLFSNKGRG